MKILPIAAAALLAATLVPATAQAAVYDKGTYSYAFTDTFRECGLRMQVDEVGRGHFVIREVKGSDGQAFLAHDNWRFHAVFTNRDNGEWYSISGISSFHEIRGTHVEGDLWQFEALEAGQPFVLRDSDGNVLLRDRGVLKFRAIFDTLGDGQPGGELVEDEITHIGGPHPGLDFDCQRVVDLIG